MGASIKGPEPSGVVTSARTGRSGEGTFLRNPLRRGSQNHYVEANSKPTILWMSRPKPNILYFIIP